MSIQGLLLGNAKPTQVASSITYVGSNRLATYPAGTTIGDLVVVTIVGTTAGGPAVTASNGASFTQITGPKTWSSLGYFQSSFYHVVASGETGITVTNAGVGNSITAVYRGATSAAASTTGSGSLAFYTGTTVQTLGITTSTSNSKIIGVVIDRDPNLYVSGSPPGFTNRGGYIGTYFSLTLYEYLTTPANSETIGPITFGQISSVYGGTAVLLELKN